MGNCSLGIDTSNYRSSAALYDMETYEWQNKGCLLEVPEGEIGIMQSQALFQHTVKLYRCVEELKMGNVCAIGVSTRPRAVEGSYMPCFLAGENVARCAAHFLNVPVYATSHQQGHIAAAALSAGKTQLLDAPFLAWHLSGGTSELLLVTPGEDKLPQCRCIGGTTDLSAGQLIDRAGRLLHLAFPSGEALDKMALLAPEEKGYPVKVRERRFSLSGMQNQIEKNANTLNPERLARFALETVANAVLEATEQALEKFHYPILCAGGVMASRVIRARMIERFPDAMFAEPVLSGDNAVGVAVLAGRVYESQRHSA